MKKLSDKQKARKKKLAKIAPPKDGKCMKCHEFPDFRGLQKHHIIPRSQGGKDTKGNIIWLCGKCHFGKNGHRTEGAERGNLPDKPFMMSGYHGTTGKGFSKEQQAGKIKRDR